MRQSRRLAIAGCSIIVTLVLFFAALEAVVAVAGVSTKSNSRFIPGIGGGHVPSAYYRQDKEGFSEGYFNSHGFRDRERTLAKPDDTFRILVLGDSYVEALQVALDASFPAVLEKELNENSHSCKVEVLNLGQSGFGTADEYMRYLNVGASYHPDLVILAFLTGNDFRNNSKFLNLAEPGFYFSLDGNQNLVLDRSVLEAYEKSYTWPRRFFQFVKEKSYLANFVSERLYLLRWQMKYQQAANVTAQEEKAATMDELSDLNVYRPEMSNRWKDAVAVTKAILGKFKSSVEANGSQFVLVTLSNAEQLDPDKQAELRRQYGQTLDFDLPDNIIEEVAKTDGITYLKLMPMFREVHARTGKNLHGFGGRESGHWNESGHRLAAEKIFEFLTQNNIPSSTCSASAHATVSKR
jgi:lysophospholipase L1-like esterase